MNSYESWVVDLQERKSSDHISDYLSESPAAKMTMDGIKEASDSKAIKYVINGAEYINDGYHIITSEYPGDAAYAWVIGTETTYVVANAVILAGRGGNLPLDKTMVGGVILGEYIGDVMREKLEEALKEYRQNEKAQKENDENIESNREQKDIGE